MGGFLWRGELPPAGFFLGLDEGDPGQEDSLEAPLLLETTPGREGVACQLGQAFLMGLAFTPLPQAAHVTGLLDYEAVFARVAFLRATVILLLGLGISWAVEGALRTIRPTRGDVGTGCVCVVARRGATSSAGRAGRKS
jgi:hypothetical protein